MAESRAKGIVKWFSELKGFGFITPHDGGADLFVHQSGIRAEGFRSLAEGEPVEFQVETGSDGRTKAVEVTGPDGAAVQGGRGRGGGYSGGRTQISPNQREGPIPARIKAELPSSNLSCKYRVMRTVMGILSKLSPDNFDHLKGQLIHCVTSADILKGVTSLIFDKAVLEPTFCPMYAQLCSDLSEKLPPFPSDELGGKEITFKRVILNFCQEAFEGADKLREEVRQMTAPEQETERKNKEALIKVRSLGNIQLIGELLKQRMIPEKIVHHIVQELLGQDSKSCPKEENVEAICHFFNTIGKQLDINRNSRRVNDVYFNQLKELSSNPQLAPRLRFMVCDVQDLRANNWVPRQEEVKAKTITETHIEAEKTLGFHPGTTASTTNPLDPQGAQGPLSPDGFRLNRPGSNHGKPQSSEDAGYAWDTER